MMREHVLSKTRKPHRGHVENAISKSPKRVINGVIHSGSDLEFSYQVPVACIVALSESSNAVVSRITLPKV